MGFLVDTIVEVIEEAALLDPWGYLNSFEDSSFLMSNPTHSANVNWHIRSCNLARRIHHGLNHEVGDVPQEYLMALLCDSRTSADTLTAYKDAWSVFVNGELGSLDRFVSPQRECARNFRLILINLASHSFFSTENGRIGLATPGCKPGDRICVMYGEDPLHILRWPAPQEGSEAIHGEGPAKFYGVAFVPHLIKAHESEAARLGPDKIFVIG